MEDEEEELIDIKEEIYKDMPSTNQSTETRRGKHKLRSKSKNLSIYIVHRTYTVFFKIMNVFVPLF